MTVSSSKEKILKKIREALSNQTPLPFSGNESKSGIFVRDDKDLELLFAEEFVKLTGKFAFCINREDAAYQLQSLLSENNWQNIYCAEKELLPFLGTRPVSDDLTGCDASVTSCHALVARTGSIVLSSASKNGRTASVYAPVHICIAYTDQLVFDTREVLQTFKDASKIPSSISFAAGPSRTADIEKTLVVGVHGPKQVYIFLIERPQQNHQ